VISLRISQIVYNIFGQISAKLPWSFAIKPWFPPYMMSTHYARSLARRIYCGRAWIVTMVTNIAIYDSCIATNEKDSKRSSAQPCISLIESLQTFSGYESFQLQLSSKIKYFRIFFLLFSLRSSLKRLEPYHYYFLSLLSF